MFIKICGTTNLADAQLAIAAGADALGFIFAPSKRQVTPAAVASIVPHLPSHVGRVGVFTAADTAEISAAVREAKLTAVQLHMTPDAHLAASLHGEFGPALELWQVVTYAVDAQDRATTDEVVIVAVAASLSEPVTLIDAAKNGASGGLGLSFPWSRVAPLVQRARSLAKTRSGYPGKLVIAGGLDAENVQGAISTLQPWGVDCVTGVEAAPGRKDPQLLHAFVKAAHRSSDSTSVHSLKPHIR